MINRVKWGDRKTTGEQFFPHPHFIHTDTVLHIPDLISKCDQVSANHLTRRVSSRNLIFYIFDPQQTGLSLDLFTYFSLNFTRHTYTSVFIVQKLHELLESY